MSKLDQAFIRAYSKEAPATRPVANPAPASGAATPAPPVPNHRVDLGAAKLHGPHARSRAAPQPLTPPVRPLDPHQVFHLLDTPSRETLTGPHLRIVTVDDAVDGHDEEPKSGEEPVTLAIESTTDTAAGPASPPARTAKLQPAWQVEHFPWPAACDTIARDIAQPLDGLCAELSRYSRLGQKVVCISGCHAGEGRTSVVLLLARKLAATGQRVAIIDGHFAAPALAQQLGLAPTAGWPELLQQSLPVEEALVESARDGVTLLPLEQPLEHDQVARHPRVWAVVRQLRAAYDLVLIDTAPLGAQAEASVTAAPTALFHPDAAILVRDVRATSGPQLQAAVRALRAAGVSTWGIIENFVRE